MTRLEWTPQSLDDLLDVWKFIARDSTLNARRYVDRLRVKAETLAETPGLGRRRGDIPVPNIRSLAEGSHVIFYSASDDLVKILRVVHGARDVDRIRLR